MGENRWTSIRVRIDMTGTRFDDGIDAEVDSLQEAQELVADFVAQRTDDDN